MKFKALVFSLTLILGLAACNDEKDYSGTYTQVDNPKISFIFEKGKNGDYQATLFTIIGKKNFANSLTGVVKKGSFYRVSDNEKVGDFKENKFIDVNGIEYKR